MDEPVLGADALPAATLPTKCAGFVGDRATAFMITHDVDEAIYLADNFLMTQRARAVLAEDGANRCAKDRGLCRSARHPYYYAVRLTRRFPGQPQARRLRSIARQRSRNVPWVRSAPELGDRIGVQRTYEESNRRLAGLVRPSHVLRRRE